MTEPKVIGVIPARFQSSRFPAKVLADILGISLVRRTYENIKKSKCLDALVVATDDKKVFDHVRAFGAEAVMTSIDCESGTARVAEVIARCYPDSAFVVNIQVDEPLLDASIIDILIEDLKRDPQAVMTTPVMRIKTHEQLHSPSVVKCVFDNNCHALYFSRSPIPFSRNAAPLENYYRHGGVYCFRKSFLISFPTLTKSPLRDIEDLEQLRVLEHGFKIRVCPVEYEGIEVNHPEDIQKVEEFLCKQNTSLSQAASSPLLAKG